ncbi:MAG: glutamate ligase domain-containing protein, partial [Methylococcus sp.]
PRRCLEFGLHQPASVNASYQPMADGLRLELQWPEGALDISLRLMGAHNAHNAAAAASAALAAGLPPEAIRRGLEAFAPVSGRGIIRQALGGATVIDDSYNANPDSVRAAIDLLASREGPGVLVLGDMGEVGEQGPEFHAEIGAYARERGLTALLGLGELTRAAVTAFNAGGHDGASHFTALEALTDRARPLATPGTTLLVKGSRFMKMERVVQALCEAENG